jgi:AraC-like DNA-binding protein
MTLAPTRSEVNAESDGKPGRFFDPAKIGTMPRSEGFAAQRLHILPSSLVAAALQRTPTARLLVTDAGYFPHAAQHEHVRRQGAAEAIVILCAEGAGWCEIAGARHEVTPGVALVIPPRTPHRYWADPGRPWSIWWLHVTGEDVADLLDAIGTTAEAPTCRLADPYRLLDLAATVCDSLGRDETSASLTAASGAAWHLLARLAAERDGYSVASNQPVRRVQEHLREHLAEPLSLPALAAIAGFSSSHFSARFRAATGFSVIEYAKRLRLARARELLATTELSVAEIAKAVGYLDPFYFSRLFRAVIGMSPRAFRATWADRALA